VAIRIGLDSFVPMQGSGGNTTLLTAANRTQVTAHNLKNNAAVEVQVTIYRSPTSQSAEGNPIDTVLIASGSAKDVSAIIGQGFAAGEFVVGVVDTVGIGLEKVVSSLTYTEFTEGS